METTATFLPGRIKSRRSAKSTGSFESPKLPSEVKLTFRRLRLGPDYEKPLDPAEIRARAGKKQANHAGGLRGEGQRLGEIPAGPAPRTPLQRNGKEKKRQRVTDSDDEDVKPYPGWDASDDSDIELLPVSQHKKRQLASPDPTPDRKKRQGDRVGAEHEANPFQVDRAVPLALDLGAGDPSAALRIAVQDSYKVNQSLKDKLQKVTARNEELETKVQLLEKEKAEVEDQSRIRALRIQ